MNNITELLSSMTDIGIRIIGSDTVNRFMTVIFGIILIFGIMNCILGYRLLRFWMMLGGFFVGAALAFVSVYTMGTETKSTYMIAVLVTGIIFAVIAFLIYKAGVFILAAGIGWTLSIYFIRPTSSAVFFACILIGIALGSLAVKYCREVIIVGTSLCGGIMAGISLAKIGDLADFPYGLGLSAGFAVLGMLIQFAINKSHEEEEEEDTIPSVYIQNMEALSDAAKIASRSIEAYPGVVSAVKQIADCKDVYVAYRKAGYIKAFFEAHREEITLHKAAKSNQVSPKWQKQEEV